MDVELWPMGTEASPRDFAFESAGGGFRGINIKDFSPLAAQRLAHCVKAIKNSNPAGRAPEHRRLGPREVLRAKLRAPGFVGGGLAGRRIRRFAMLAGSAGPRD